MFNLKQLETFYWAAKLGSFTAAAERLNYTQSTVSMRIHDLEQDLGVSLFDRSQRTARITSKGRDLLKHAEELLNLSAEVHERIAAPGTRRGIVRLGVAEMISVTWLPKLIQILHERYPDILLELDEALTEDLVDRLRAGALDLILAPGRMPGYNLIPRSLGSVAFVWMASPKLGIPAGTLTPKDLQRWPVIALARQSYHHARIEDWFHSRNALCRRIYTCKSFGVASSLAVAALGITLLPVDNYQDMIASGNLQVIATEPPMTPVEFTVTMSVDSPQSLPKLIADLACEVSTFDKAEATEEIMIQ